MKNLTVHQLHCKSVDILKHTETNQELLSYVKCVINPSNNDLYILLDQNLYVLPILGEVTVVDYSSYSFNDMISMEYCITLQEIYCAYASGHIAKVDIKNPTRVDYNIVTGFNSGLQCIKFSPDHELIAAVTGAGMVITMVLDFQVMSEVDLYSEEFGLNKFINVGWGKKETQFHGSVGKAAAQAKQEQLIPNEHDNSQTCIAWREDGTLFAVNFLHKETKIRQFKIFNREGVLYYTSEHVNGLEECIAWGNIIAVSRILVDKYFITFFEKNGLKYKELLLPFKPQEVKVKDLLWSSDILAVVCNQLETNATLIQLWTENNAHWYLKQTLIFSAENPLLYVTWNSIIDQPHKKELIYLTAKHFICCSFNWCWDHSRGKTSDDRVVCGVIDGNKILVTDFKDGVIPPPMAHQTLEISKSQNAIIFAPNINNQLTNSNDFCTISYDNKLTFFKQKKECLTLTYEIINSYNIGVTTLDHFIYKSNLKIKEAFYYHMHHFLWFTEKIILFSVTIEKFNLLCVLSLDEIHCKDHLKIQEVHNLCDPIEHIVSSPDSTTAYIKVKDQIYTFTQDGSFKQITITVPKSSIQLEVTKIDSIDVILALSQENNFSVDGKEIADNITSFYVHSDFMLLTTLQHTLICVLLNEAGIKQLSKHDLTVKPWLNKYNDIAETLFSDIYIRRLEKDSRIIVAIPNESKVILQMHRGNLECIQPRALSVHILKHYLNNCDYVTALDMMTKERINLNLIYDHNPQLFLDNVHKFIDDIIQHNKLNWLNLFLSELQDIDVTVKMYKFCYTDQSDVRSIKTTVNKVDKVCKLLRDAMEKHKNANNLIQPILISFVKNQQRQGLENALSRVKQVKILESSQKSAHFSTVSAYEALKCLLHFVDINKLYDTALGMYDLELAMFIASKSSKDPKEYIPFLNNFKSLDESRPNYMKYSINMHLKRFETALEYLSKDKNKFEECLDLIRSQKLYKIAINLFEKNTADYKKVAEAYGEFLLSENKYTEAGMMFYRGGYLDRALESFSHSSDNWEDVIIISKEMNVSPARLYKLYKAQAKYLIAEGKYQQAAVILKDYLNDAEEAVAVLCEGRCWKNAIRIAIDVQRLDLNETHIKPGIKEHTEHVISQLIKMKEDFLKYKTRLAIVRTDIKDKEKQFFNGKIYDDNPESNKEIPDTISDTMSIADSTSSRITRTSLVSSKSYRSSKNRRKQERKLFSLKEGSMFEDLSLIHALYQIINNAYKSRVEWCQLVHTLIRFEYDESAKKILNEEREFFQMVESSKAEIWNKLAPSSLSDIEKNGNYTQAELQVMLAPIKLIGKQKIR
ncbi:hypothetical protein PUN28_005627 [Cardiocondyla obscurior]|uniref:Elongator complex protein 1 n=1 Tax=Cardiocondyla obscurior TaxID=286306 RepID=A0AAW2GK58_9HYME